MNWSGVRPHFAPPSPKASEGRGEAPRGNRQASGITNELLPVLLVLYPLLLLLDSIEPGFVRSVVNPHVFLLALLIAGILAGPGDRAHVVTARTNIIVAGVSGTIGGLWVWWSISGGRFGIPIALLAAVAITAAVRSVTSGDDSL